MSRRIIHAIVDFGAVETEQVSSMMRVFCSCVRSAYNIYRHESTQDHHIPYRKLADRYPELSGAWRQQACFEAKRYAVLPGVVFGGRGAWNDVASGKLSNGQWKSQRSSTLYSAGDRSYNGNRLMRVRDGKLAISNPTIRCGAGKWIEGTLWVPKKFKKLIEHLPDNYDVRLLRKSDSKFEAKIGFEVGNRVPEANISKGVIGIDCNPDGCAVAEVDSNGNLLSHLYEQNTRIRDAKTEKRSNDVRLMAKTIVEHAEKANKPLVVEALSFKDRTSGPRKFRRTKSNFIYRQMLDAITSRAARCDVPVIDVKPAFTSVLGSLKYAKMYSLNRHDAAALVIARRGMGIQERQDFRAITTRSRNEKVNLEGRSFETALTKKSWSWLRGEFLKPNSAILTGSVLAVGSKPAIGTSAGETPAGKASTTGRCRSGGNAAISSHKEAAT